MALVSLLKRQTLPANLSARQQRYLDAISWSLLLKQMEGTAGGGPPHLTSFESLHDSQKKRLRKKMRQIRIRSQDKKPTAASIMAAPVGVMLESISTWTP